MNVVAVAAVWLHLAATVVLFGYFTTLGLVVLPVLRRSLEPRAFAAAVSATERRALPWLVGSLAAFLATGVYLMGTDARYAGIGSVDSSWATILLVKHVVIVGMLGLGLYVDALAVRAGRDDDAAPAAASRFGLGVFALAALGAVVLLLTATAQLA